MFRVVRNFASGLQQRQQYCNDLRIQPKLTSVLSTNTAIVSMIYPIALSDEKALHVAKYRILHSGVVGLCNQVRLCYLAIAHPARTCGMNIVSGDFWTVIANEQKSAKGTVC